MREALLGRRRHQQLIFAEGVRWDARLQSTRVLAESQEIPVEHIPRARLDELIGDARHQGIALRTSPYVYVPFADLSLRSKPILLMDHLQDPQNVGALLRSAEAFGVSGVVIPKDRSAEITPSVVNASAGAVEHVQVSQVTNLGRAINDIKQAGYWVIGLDRAASARSLETIEPPEPFAVVVGAEGKGLGTAVAAACDLLVRIGQVGQIDSLNAAVAGSIALFYLTQVVRAPTGQT